MSKLLVVFGATGHQGGSTVNFVLNDPELSKEFRVRAVTRDPSKAEAQALQTKGVEVVQGDLNDEQSIKKAVQGAHTVFAVTTTAYGRSLQSQEIEQGKLVADATVTAGAEYIIWSTSQHTTKISGGKLPHVTHFENKAVVEDYIRSLPIKSSFFAPGSFMQNFQAQAKPRSVGDGTYAIRGIVKPATEVPFIDIAEDTGKWIGAILADPDKYEGKILSAATRFYTYVEAAQIISKATGKTVQYKQIPVEVYRSFLPPAFDTELVEMMQFFEEFGYYGPQQHELVEWSAAQARGKLTTLEEYLAREPMKIE